MSSQQDVAAAHALVMKAMYERGGIVEMLSPAWRVKLARTWIFVDDAPTEIERGWVDTPAPMLLMGLFTEPSTGIYVIQLFATELVRGNRDPVKALLHEMGHWDYDHGETCPECTSLERRQRPHVHRDGCAWCDIWGEANTAFGLMASLNPRAHMRHAIPLGGGGTIPEARYHIGRAQLIAERLRPAGDSFMRQLVERCAQLLADAMESLEGWLDVEDTDRALAATRLAWDAAGDITYAHFAAVREMVG